MPPISWLQIRTLNGSKWDAFEECCCQLAHLEPVPAGSRFSAKGKPDSGIECFWILPTGEEWGWQAKFFPDGLNKSRWAQCDKSVKKALDGHPNLTKLFFCFPYKFPDDRKPNRISATLQWQAHCRKWTNWAAGRSKPIEFILWDEHELMFRLSKPENQGRWWFWFNTPLMDAAWFGRNVAASVKLANERYSRELHFDLPIAHYFEALCRTPAFTTGLNNFGAKLNEAVTKVGRHSRSEELGGFDGPIAEVLNAALNTLNLLSLDIKTRIDFDKLTNALLAVQDLVRKARSELYTRLNERAKEFEKTHDRHPNSSEISSEENAHYTLGEISTLVNELLKFCSSKDAELSNLPSMLLIGEAGLGKTHLVCSAAEKRIAEDLPTILLLGQQFHEGDPWSQIISNLGLSCDRETFLGALDSIGESTGSRTLIVIDAINEGAGMRYWRNHLASMLSHVHNYPYVAIAVTIRKAYLDKTAIPINDFVSITHHGFSGFTGEAARHFFKHYGLAEPNVPLLDPEFDSPLFLKLICSAIKESGSPEIPSELIGVSAIFKFVLDETNTRLADKLDYPRSNRMVQKAVLRIAEIMSETGNEFVSFDVAYEELKRLHPTNKFSDSLIQHLISEHLLVRSPGFDNSDDEIVQFTYQRLSDHLIVKNILAVTPKGKLKGLFKPKGVFGRKMIDDTYGIYFFGTAGWLEALAVQLPETYGLEIDSLIRSSWGNEVIRRSFISSLIWRNPAAITLATKKRVVELIESEHYSEVLDALIAVTARPGHPYNGKWLDARLRALNMPKRDEMWSTYLFGKIEEQTNVGRLIEWAWAERKISNFSDEVVSLASLTLTWCLTTSDRFVRDRATKALVALLEQRIPVLRWLLKHFGGIAEPYVQERLHAVAYGCAILTSQNTELAALAQEVYDRIFRNGSPPASVLLRDHARGVIERATRIGLNIDYDPSLIIPPYKSKWPKPPPSLIALCKKFRGDDRNEEHWGLSRIYGSVTFDDFSRYILTDVSWWSNQRCVQIENQSPKEWMDKLIKSLSKDNQKTIEMYVDCLRRLGEHESGTHESPGYKASLGSYVDYVELHLPRLLGQKNGRTFRTKLIPYFKNQFTKRPNDTFETEMFRRLILQRILELGYTNERFGEFDKNVRTHGRDSRKVERVGKKYQWIAYDEIHARISDNFGLSQGRNSIMNKCEWENGTWPDHFRDIDPSLLLKSTPHDESDTNYDNWWTPYKYDGWASAPSPSLWLKQISDLPEPLEFLECTGKDNRKWMVMDSYTSWIRKSAIGTFQGRESDSHEMHYIFRSYVVKRDHLGAVLRWGKEQNWINECLPSADSYSQYFQEHYWSPYFDYSLDESLIERTWPSNIMPHPVVQTTTDFTSGISGYDCSIDKGFIISMPSRWLAQKMGLEINGRHGDFISREGNLASFDPSTRESGHHTLLIDQEILRGFLEREKLAVFWTLLGEKNVYPPGMSGAWLGCLTVLGIYSWTGNAITGGFRTELIPGRDRI